jgi:excisionase family DNA binding protein
VAERFDVTPATVRQWVARGHLRPVRRLGVTHVFRASDVFDAYERIMRKRKATGQDRRRGRFFMEPRRIDVIPAKHWDAVMTVDDAAELIGVSPATIRSWIHRGHLATTASSTRRAVRVRAGDVIRTAHERTIPRPGHRVRPSQKA